MPTLAELRPEYERLFNSCIINANKFTEIDSIASKIIAARPRYETIGKPLNIPWYFIGVLHAMEGSLNFKKHLHNGDPLTARTIQVPKGRPKTGNPPFTFEVSCADALQMDGYDNNTDWSVAAQLFLLEKFNGFGYRRTTINIPSPYLWSYSSNYTKGKFSSDGKYDPNLVSKQPGSAAILRRLTEKQVINFSDQQLNRMKMIKEIGETIILSPGIATEDAKRLQDLLNDIGFPLMRDGKAGNNTSNAYKQATGKYLKGDPRRTS